MISSEITNEKYTSTKYNKWIWWNPNLFCPELILYFCILTNKKELRIWKLHIHDFRFNLFASEIYKRSNWCKYIQKYIWLNMCEQNKDATPFDKQTALKIDNRCCILTKHNVNNGKFCCNLLLCCHKCYPSKTKNQGITKKIVAFVDLFTSPGNLC